MAFSYLVATSRLVKSRRVEQSNIHDPPCVAVHYHTRRSMRIEPSLLSTGLFPSSRIITITITTLRDATCPRTSTSITLTLLYETRRLLSPRVPGSRRLQQASAKKSLNLSPPAVRTSIIPPTNEPGSIPPFLFPKNALRAGGDWRSSRPRCGPPVGGIF